MSPLLLLNYWLCSFFSVECLLINSMFESCYKSLKLKNQLLTYGLLVENH